MAGDSRSFPLTLHSPYFSPALASCLCGNGALMLMLMLMLVPVPVPVPVLVLVLVLVLVPVLVLVLRVLHHVVATPRLFSVVLLWHDFGVARTA